MLFARNGGGIGQFVSSVVVLATAETVAVADVQPHAGMLRYPHVSAEQIAFVYANDLWVVDRDGGLATPVAGPRGIEAFPRFSADGQTIAFMANYDGDTDIYTIPVQGGEPFRVTHHPVTEVLHGWTPDGELLFRAAGMTDYERPQLFTVSPQGGMPERLPVPYGGNGVVSPDEVWLAYTPYVRDTRTWKRYRGGRAADVWLFNLKDHSSKRLTDWEGTDSIPMWHNDKIYFVSDAGPNARLNIWEYDTTTDERRQVTKFSEFDVKWPALGPGPEGQGEIVFQNGADLYLLDLGTEMARVVEVTIPGDRPQVRPQRVNARRYMQRTNVSATGKRIVVEARGDIWTLPAEKGPPRNLTRSSGVAERDPSWSPDGQWIAYLSDERGEYDLYITQSDGKGETRRLAELGLGYRYLRGWSPDSEYVAIAEKSGVLWICAVEDGKLTQVDVDPAGRELGVSWSHDSRWIAYAKASENRQTAVWLYDVENDERQQVTSGMFVDTWPTFDREGKYLYFASHRSFRSPIYEDVGSTFVYTGTDILLAVPLKADAEYPWAPENDEEEWEEDEEEEDGDDEDEDGEKDDEDGEPDDEDDDGDENGDNEDEDDSDEEEADEPVADDGVSGTWEGKISGGEPLPPDGLPLSFTLRVDAAGSVTGSMTAGPYAGTISEGEYDKVSGALRFTLDVDTGEAGIQSYAVTATVSGSEMSGSVTGEGFAASFECERTSTASPDDDEEEEGEDDEDEEVEIDLEGFEERAFQLPVGRGAFSNLAVNDENQLIYVRRGPRGSGTPTSIKLFDIDDDEKEEKTVVKGAGSFAMTADGKKLMVRSGGYSIVKARPGQKLTKKVPLDGMDVVIEPRQEWRQVFVDAWRIFRDFFYVENMHGVDWEGLRDQYAAMLDDCVSRDDVRYVMRELISELNVGHAYYRSGASENGPSVNVGLLGVDFDLHDGAYRIAKIHRGGAWDVDARNPFEAADGEVNEGDYVLAVNGIEVDTSKDPWAAFLGLANKQVILTVSEKPTIDDDAREVSLKLIGNEHGLRYRSFVEANRKYVDEKTDGRVGYIHVPDTGVNGQNNLFRQYYGQRDKEALIIDERWNHGGQIPVRFIELLNRPIMNYWAVRDGWANFSPPDGFFGPKCMLINESAGSGGDMFPKLFRQNKLGKLIGTRTWGGLVGISGNPRLIDGHSLSVPTFGYFDKDGTWGIEGHGVDPDIEVIDDPALMADGGDPQLDAAIEHILAEVERNPYVPAPRPADPVRTGVGISEEDK